MHISFPFTDTVAQNNSERRLSKIQVRHFSTREELELYIFLLENTEKGKLRYGAVKEASVRFGVSRNTVGRIRARVNSCKKSIGAVTAIQMRKNETSRSS